MGYDKWNPCMHVWFVYGTWWRHQMKTFSALLALCAGPGEFRAKMPVSRRFDVFFDLRLNKRLSKQSWGWWFETLSRPLWRHRNEIWVAVLCCVSLLYGMIKLYGTMHLQCQKLGKIFAGPPYKVLLSCTVISDVYRCFIPNQSIST